MLSVAAVERYLFVLAFFPMILLTNKTEKYTLEIGKTTICYMIQLTAYQ